MAVLEKIREKTVTILIVIGVALIAFVVSPEDLMNFLKNNQESNALGSIYGEELNPNEFSEYLDIVKSQYSSQSEGQQMKLAWDFLVQEKIINKQSDEIGLTVSPKEIYELETGKINEINRHSAFTNFFTSNGQNEFDIVTVEDFFFNFSEQRQEIKNYILQLEDGVINERIQQKYQSLVENSIYTTNYELLNILNGKSQNAQVSYVSIPFDQENIEVSELEIKEYFEKNKSDFQNETETRDLEYVTFTVIPNSEDDINTRNELTDLSIKFQTSTNDNLFARRHATIDVPQFPFLTSENITDPKFSDLIKMDQGTVDGPYKLSNGQYRLSKLSEIAVRPDSVEARHILLKVENYTTDSARTILKNQISNGADFDQFATEFDYPSSKIGGKLGWFSEGEMVSEFNDVCFNSNKGDLKIIQTQYGMHLINIMSISKKNKKYKIIYLDKEVVASSNTKDKYFDQANDFISNLNKKNSDTSFIDFAEARNLLVREDINLDIMKFNVSALENSRDIVKWMFGDERKVGEYSNSIYTCGQNYVVVNLSKISPKGNRDMESLEEIISQKIMKEKQYNFISNGDTYSLSRKTDKLDSIASLFNTSINIVNGVNFTNNDINGIGNEPSLVGTIKSLEIGDISSLLRGENAAYIVKVISKNDDSILEVNDQQRKEIEKSNSLGLFYNIVMKTLKQNASIEDNRIQYY